MYFSSKRYVSALLYLTVFIGAMGVEFPFYNLFTISKVNLFIIPYFFLVLFAFTQKDFFGFLKENKNCITIFFIVLLIAFSMCIATIYSLYVFDNPTLNSIMIIIRMLIYASFFLFIPYFIHKFGIDFESILFTWLLAIVIMSFLYYFDNPDIIGSFIYLKGQNILGLYVSFTIFFAFYFSHKNFERKLYFKSIIYLMVSSFLLVTSLFTWSKSSWISIIIPLIILILVNTLKRGKIVFLFLILGFISFIFFINSEYILALVANEWNASSGSHSNEERIISAIAGIKETLFSYFIGVGPKNYSVAIEYFNIKDLLWIQPDPHNGYVQLLAEYGLLSFISFMSLLILIYKKLNLSSLLDLYLFAGLLSLLIFTNFSGQTVTQNFLYLYGALIIGYKLQGKKYV